MAFDAALRVEKQDPGRPFVAVIRRLIGVVIRASIIVADGPDGEVRDAVFVEVAEVGDGGAEEVSVVERPAKAAL